MKRLIAILALSTAFGVAACDDPYDNDQEVAETGMEAPVAPAAEDVTAPVVAPSAVDTPAPSTSTLPAEKRSSEESVQPQSETLFY